jgi:DNA invertase Pin-like site-specific DNA recombinase
MVYKCLRLIKQNAPLQVVLQERTRQLCDVIDTIKQKHLRLVIVGSITIDCRNGELDAMSSAFLMMAGVFSELELQMIRSRVRSSLQHCKAQGKKLGRKPTTKDDIPAIFYKHYPSYIAGSMNVSELARVCGLSRPTVYKYLKLVG